MTGSFTGIDARGLKQTTVRRAVVVNGVTVNKTAAQMATDYAGSILTPSASFTIAVNGVLLTLRNAMPIRTDARVTAALSGMPVS